MRILIKQTPISLHTFLLSNDDDEEEDEEDEDDEEDEEEEEDLMKSLPSWYNFTFISPIISSSSSPEKWVWEEGKRDDDELDVVDVVDEEEDVDGGGRESLK